MDRSRTLHSTGAAGGGWHAYVDSDGLRCAVAPASAPWIDDPVLVRPEAIDETMLIARPPAGGALVARIARVVAGGAAIEGAHMTFSAVQRLAGLAQRITAQRRVLVWLDPSWLIDQPSGAVLVLQPATLTLGANWPSAPTSPFIAPEFRAGGVASDAAAVFVLAQAVVHLATGRAPGPATTLPAWGGLSPLVTACTDPDPASRPSLAQFSEFLELLSFDSVPRRTVWAGGVALGVRTSIGIDPETPLGQNDDAFAAHGEHGTLSVAVSSAPGQTDAASRAADLFAEPLHVLDADPRQQSAAVLARADEAIGGAGAMTAAALVGDRLALAHVGTGQAILLRPHEPPAVLTRDHDSDAVTGLAAVLGEPTINLIPNDCLVLLGAGSRAALEPQQVASIVERSRGDAQRIADGLVDAGLRRGSRRPLTVVVVEIGQPGRDSTAAPTVVPVGLGLPTAPGGTMFANRDIAPLPNSGSRAAAQRQRQIRAGLIGLGALVAAALLWSLFGGGGDEAPTPTTPPLATVTVDSTTAPVVLLPPPDTSTATEPLAPDSGTVTDTTLLQEANPTATVASPTPTTKRRRTTTTTIKRSTTKTTVRRRSTTTDAPSATNRTPEATTPETSPPAPPTTVDGPIVPAVTAPPIDTPSATDPVPVATVPAP